MSRTPIVAFAFVVMAAMSLSATSETHVRGDDTVADPSTRGATVETISARVEHPARYSPDKEEDLATVAAELRIGQGAARRLYGWQDGAAVAVTGLKEAWPTDFTYSRVVTSGPTAPSLVVAFKGAPPLVDRYFTQLPVSVQVIADVGYTEREFHEEVQRLHYSTIDRYGTQEVSTGGDIETGTIEGFVDSVPAQGVPEVLGAELHPSLEGVTFRLSVAPHDDGHHDTISTGDCFTPVRAAVRRCASG